MIEHRSRRPPSSRWSPSTTRFWAGTCACSQVQQPGPCSRARSLTAHMPTSARPAPPERKGRSVDIVVGNRRSLARSSIAVATVRYRHVRRRAPLRRDGRLVDRKARGRRGLRCWSCHRCDGGQCPARSTAGAAGQIEPDTDRSPATPAAGTLGPSIDHHMTLFFEGPARSINSAQPTTAICTHSRARSGHSSASKACR
jgi:hypothetical protein